MTSFMFLAPALAPFGEAVCGRQLALAAHAAGHRVTFLHTSSVAPVFEGVPFARGVIDDVLPTLGVALRDAVRARGVDVIVLVDALSTYGVLGSSMRASLEGCGAKVIALDLWSCHESDLVCDMGEITTKLDPLLVELPALRPAPNARPDAPGAYRALPPVTPVTAEARRSTRARLGIGEHERVVFTATGAWQAARKYPPASSMYRIATAWPAALSLVLRRLDDVRVVHVGPEPLPLGDRYQHVPRVPPAEFERLLGASDVSVGNNVMATSIATALALDVPHVVIENSRFVATSAEATTSELRAWLAPVAPLYPFAVLPLGLRSFVAPMLANNPFTIAIDRCDLLDPEATAARMSALLEGDATMSTARANYRERIAALPSGLEQLIALA